MSLPRHTSVSTNARVGLSSDVKVTSTSSLSFVVQFAFVASTFTIDEVVTVTLVADEVVIGTQADDASAFENQL